MNSLTYQQDFERIKRNCRGQSNNLRRKGILVVPEKCQFGWCEDKIFHKSQRLQMHHEDYTKPDWVVWLCASCHIKYHCGTINGPKNIFFNWNWQCYKEYNPKYFQEYRDKQSSFFLNLIKKNEK